VVLANANHVAVKGVQELIAQFSQSTHEAGFLSIVVALCYWATVYALEMLPHTVVFTPVTRKVLSDYAYPVSGPSYLDITETNMHISRLPPCFGPASSTFPER
jgi:hypothetical protein